MTAQLQGALVLTVGLIAVRLAATGDALLYLKPAMRPWLLLAAAALVVLGGYHALRDAVDTPRGPWVGMLLLLPVLTLVVVAPGPLGAYAAARANTISPAPPPGLFAPLSEPVDGAVDLRLREFISRARYGDRQSMNGRVRLLGFVAPPHATDEAGTFRLTRFMMVCCAADGRPLQVSVRARDVSVPPSDTWVEVEGTWQPGPATGDPAAVPVLTLADFRIVDPPQQPYES